MSSPTSSTAAPGTTAGTSSAVLMILGSCISLQFGAAIATTLFPAIGPAGTTALRLGFAALVLLVIVRPKVRALTREQWLAILAFGVVIGLMNGFFYASLARIPLGTAVAIEFLGPLTVAAVLSTKPTDLLWVALALVGVSLFGLESALGLGELDLLGVLFVLIAAVFWGLYVVTSAKVGQIVPGQTGLALAMAIGALTVLPTGAPGAWQGLISPPLALAALGTAVLASVLPYTLELSALRRLPRHVFGVLLSLEPAIALLAGVLLLSQGLTLLRVLATVLVVVASAGVTLTARRAAEDHPVEPEHPGLQDIPVATHATATGEIPALTAEQLGLLEEFEDLESPDDPEHSGSAGPEEPGRA